MAVGGRSNGSSPLSIGWIPYWNLLPFLRELERSASGDIEFHKGHPSVVNKLLGEGKVALAPSSSICLLRHPNVEVSMPLGIASSGPVLSVYLGIHNDDPEVYELIRERHELVRNIFKEILSTEQDSRKAASAIFKAAKSLPELPLEMIPGLSLTPASATSNQLGRILYRLWFGDAAYELKASDRAVKGASVSSLKSLEMVIGDEALIRRYQFKHIIDLGDVWKNLTDLPFVFAVWQQNRKVLSPQQRQRFFDVAEMAQAKMRVDPNAYIPDPPPLDGQGRSIDLSTYWKTIQYRLGPNHFRGLALFLALARANDPVKADEQAVLSIMRWEALGELEIAKV